MRVAIIPARGGSRRIPRKNIRLFHDKPIIAYSIETARAASEADGSALFDDIFVSTEDEEIANVAERYGAKVVTRSPGYEQDEVGTQDVMQNALGKLANSGQRAVAACCIYATCPMLTNGDIERGWRALNANASTRYAFAVCEEPFGPAGYFYWGDAHAFTMGMPLVAEYSVIVPIPAARCVDINTEADWLRAERMYAELHKEAA